MIEVFTPDACPRLGAVLADCQKRVRRNGRPIRVVEVCGRLEMSTATFYNLREAE